MTLTDDQIRRLIETWERAYGDVKDIDPRWASNIKGQIEAYRSYLETKIPEPQIRDTIKALKKLIRGKKPGPLTELRIKGQIEAYETILKGECS